MNKKYSPINKSRRSSILSTNEINVINRKIIILQNSLNQLIRDRNIIVKTVKNHENVALQYESMLIRHQNIENEKITCVDKRITQLEQQNLFLHSQYLEMKEYFQQINQKIQTIENQIEEIRREQTIYFSKKRFSSRKSLQKRESSLVHFESHLQKNKEFTEIKNYLYSDLTKCVLKLYKRIKSLEKQ